MPQLGEMSVCKYCGLAIVYRYVGHGVMAWVHYAVTITTHKAAPAPVSEEDENKTDSEI